MQILDLSGNADIINWGYLILTLLIFILGFYAYFVKDEKDRKNLLISLTFFFFFLAGLQSTFAFLNNDILNPWSGFFLFVGAICAFIAAEPWKAFTS